MSAKNQQTDPRANLPEGMPSADRLAKLFRNLLTIGEYLDRHAPTLRQLEIIMNQNAQRLKWCLDRIAAADAEIARLNGVNADLQAKVDAVPVADPDEVALDAQVDAMMATNPNPTTPQ